MSERLERRSCDSIAGSLDHEWYWRGEFLSGREEEIANKAYQIGREDCEDEALK